jgi:hypothetical protein
MVRNGDPLAAAPEEVIPPAAGVTKKKKKKKAAIQSEPAASADQFPRSHDVQELMDAERELAQGVAGLDVNREAAAGAEPPAGGEPPAAEMSKEQMAARMEELTRENSVLRHQANEVGGGAVREQQQQQKGRMPDLTKVVNRPSCFDGSSSLFHSWRNEMQMYLSIMRFPAEDEPGVAQSYLRGNALEWWIQKMRQLRAKGEPLPVNWAAFLSLLSERFEHRNPELAARERLMSLKQGCGTLQQYLKEFEGLFAYIPEYTESDKIHRFLHGLQPELKARFCVDPSTKKWWTSFDQLVAYTSSYMADDVTLTAAGAGTDLLKSVGAAMQHDPSKAQAKGWGRGRGRMHLPGGKLPRRFQKQLSQLLSSGVIKPRGNGGRKGQQTGQKAVPTNAKGQAVNRSSAVVRFCHRSGNPQQKQLCLGCYGEGHMVAECPHDVNPNNPPGFSG